MTAATEILQMPAAKAPEPAERGGAMALRERPEVVLGPEDPRSPVGDVLLPQWVAQAGLRAFRPFIAERPTQWMVLLPRSRAGIATVVATRTSGLSILGQDPGPNRWSLFWRRGSLYEIDLGLHHTWFEVELPSEVDMFSFRAHVAVEWRVFDAVQVVKDHVWDVREVLRPALVALLAHDTRIFRVDQVFEAERAVAAALHGNDIGKGYGLETNLRIQLSADPGAAAHAAERRALQQKIEIEGLQFDHRRLQEANEEHVLKGRIRLYREIIAAGDVDQFALQLARNPEEVAAVVQMVREVRQEDHRQITSFLTTLLDSGAIERWEVNDTVQTALDWLKKSNDRVVQTGETHIPWQRNGSAAERNGVSMAK